MPRPSSTSASRYFIGRIAYPALAFLLIALGAELVDHAIWRLAGPWSTPEWKEKRLALLQLERSGHRVDVLVVGDSTMTSGLFPSLLAGPNGFNLGRSALNPSELPVLEKQMEAWDVRPEMILISITPSNFTSAVWENRYAEPLDSKLSALRVSFYANPAISDPMFLPGKSAVRSLLSAQLKSDHPLELKRERSFSILPDGTREPLAIIRSNPRDRFFFDFPEGTRATIPASYFDALTAFKRACEARGAKVYWVDMPMHPTYASLLVENQPALLESYQAGVSRIFGARILKDPGTTSEDEFLDGVHLTPEGGRALSRRFADMPRLRR